MSDYPRDMVGYGPHPPQADWPNGARIALQIVLNYEEGGENTILHGDRASESFLSEIVGAPAFVGQRHMSMESLYEYGSRAGVWRLLRLFSRAPHPGHRLRGRHGVGAQSRRRAGDGRRGARGREPRLALDRLPRRRRGDRARAHACAPSPRSSA